ncbi:MAG: porin [Planctomycetaceae bacterium]|nr:porin [Planctomycetaceae bacterium]
MNTRTSWKSFLAGAALFGGIMPCAASAGDPYGMRISGTVYESVFTDIGSEAPVIRLVSGNCCPDTECCAPVDCGETACCDIGCGEGCCDFSDGGDGGDIAFGGWVQLGYHNGLTPLSVARNDYSSFNNHPHRLNLQQGWLYAEKIADGTEGLDWGFRMDAMYGVDASDTSAFGNPVGTWDFGGSFERGAGYGFAIPQLYAEVAIGEVSVKAGHFYTLVGYEVVTAPDNFFYSHSLTMFNSEPFTHTGMVATVNASDDVTLYGGWTLGWDTGFSQFAGGNSFLGGFSVPLMEDVTLTYVTTFGDLGWRGDNGYSHSIVIDTTLTENLNWVLQSDFVSADSQTRVNPANQFLNDDSVGVNSYMFYTINDWLKAGSRMEWWKGDGTSHYGITSGINVLLADNFIIRPEIRHQWSPANQPNGIGADSIFGMDAILTY